MPCRVGDIDTARARSQEALAICDEIGDRWNRAGPLATLSFVHFLGGGSLDEARRLAEEAFALYRELGDVFGQVAMNPLIGIAERQGDLDAAERFAADAATVAVGTAWEGTALINLGEVLLAKGDTEGAEAALQRGLIRALDGGVEIWFRIALRDLANITAMREAPRRAAQLVGASRRNAHHYGLDPAIYEAIETQCRTTLDEATFTAATEEGYQMTHEQLLTLACGS